MAEETYTLEQIRAAYWRARNRDLGPAASPTWAEIEYELCPFFRVTNSHFGHSLRWSVVFCDRALCYCAKEHEAQRIADALNATDAPRRAPVLVRLRDGGGPEEFAEGEKR